MLGRICSAEYACIELAYLENGVAYDVLRFDDVNDKLRYIEVLLCILTMAASCPLAPSVLFK